jgi:2-polyprenyl-3-methyl-5-hydroxy-6-metoxy-1,4-benzoquinol methylase
VKIFNKKMSAREIKYIKIISDYYHKSGKEFKYLYIPKYEITPDGIGLEYINGVQYLWSENKNSAGYGGRGISINTIDLMFKAAEELYPFTNGDFNYRNMIFTNDGKLALVDFEQASIHPYAVEYNLAYQYVLMWNNIEWKREFLRSFTFNKDIFEKYVYYISSRLKSSFVKYPNIIEELNNNTPDHFAFKSLWLCGKTFDELTSSFYQNIPDIIATNISSDTFEKFLALNIGNKVKDKDVLDFGCSSGFMALLLKISGAKSVTGIDISQERVNECKLINSIYNCNMDFINDNNITGKYDVIVCTSVIHYIKDKYDFILKVYDSLNVGGIFILETPIVEKDIETKTGVVDTYLPSEATIIDPIYSLFDVIYKGISNINGRYVYHFKRKIK